MFKLSLDCSRRTRPVALHLLQLRCSYANPMELDAGSWSQTHVMQSCHDLCCRTKRESCRGGCELRHKSWIRIRELSKSVRALVNLASLSERVDSCQLRNCNAPLRFASSLLILLRLLLPKLPADLTGELEQSLRKGAIGPTIWLKLEYRDCGIAGHPGSSERSCLSLMRQSQNNSHVAPNSSW